MGGTIGGRCQFLLRRWRLQRAGRCLSGTLGIRAVLRPAGESEDVPRIEAPLLLHYGELDQRINAGWPAYEAALKANGKRYTAHIYAGANHGFHNDTTPRYDEQAAKLAEERTITFFGAPVLIRCKQPRREGIYPAFNPSAFCFSEHRHAEEGYLP